MQHSSRTGEMKGRAQPKEPVAGPPDRKKCGRCQVWLLTASSPPSNPPSQDRGLLTILQINWSNGGNAALVPCSRAHFPLNIS